MTRTDWLSRIMKVTLLLTILCISVFGRHAWETPGCMRLGHSRMVHIRGCVSFPVTLNACRGYCLSVAFPSKTKTLRANPDHEITSRGHCCSITRTHNVRVKVWCIDGFKTFVFKSAAECSCSICRHG